MAASQFILLSSNMEKGAVALEDADALLAEPSAEVHFKQQVRALSPVPARSPVRVRSFLRRNGRQLTIIRRDLRGSTRDPRGKETEKEREREGREKEKEEREEGRHGEEKCMRKEESSVERICVRIQLNPRLFSTAIPSAFRLRGNSR